MKTNCPLCDSAATALSFEKAPFQYRRCKCGSLFVADQLSSEEIASYYSGKYFEVMETEVEGRGAGYPSYMASQKSLEQSFREKFSLIKQRIPAGKLLDAGAAYGTFLKVASAQYDCLGLDISEYAVSIARDILKVNCRIGDIQKKTEFDDNSFDVVTLWDIIEHLSTPVTALAEIHRILRPGGWLFISTDDVSNWLPKVLGPLWWSLSPPFHLCHFSRKGMRMAIQRAGDFGEVDFLPDRRIYGLPEVVEYFSVAYHSKSLHNLANKLNVSCFKKLNIKLARPEQFITVVRKKHS